MMECLIELIVLLREQTTRPGQLMTRKQLTDPFGSDEEDDAVGCE